MPETVSALESYLAQATWLEETSRIPVWEKRGILHGFEGVGYDLPSQGVSLQQVHGTQIVDVSHPQKGLSPPEGDGLVTHTRGVRLAIKTADCLPVLVSGPRGVLALHAGWKGLAQDILGSAHQMWQGDWQHCEVALGPCISLESFEVGPEVVQSFRTQKFAMEETEFAFASSKGTKDRWHLDLAMLAAFRLRRLGLPAKQLYIVRTCTKKFPQRWHSFRRDGGKAGRNWSWIEYNENF